MSFIRFFKSRSSHEDSIYVDIRRIKTGDDYLRDKLIKDYMPFITKSVAKAAQKHIDVENSDELSIGMCAFNEALDSYNESRGSNFFSYCDLLIKSRIIDYYRKNQKEQKVYPFTYFENDDTMNFEERYLQSDSFYQYENIEIEEEILLFKKNLGLFKISLDDLIKKTPKHRDSIKLCVNIAQTLSSNEQLFDKLMKNRVIPLKELLEMVDVHKRTIERNRKFIIAVTLIIKSDLTVMKSYVEDVCREDTAYGL